MCMISVHFDQVVGPVKPMHAVNNGPAHALSNVAINNHEAWRDAGIPYARNHDASLYPGYGFAGHKGYPTKAHKLAVYRLGPTPIHRKSFLGFLEKDKEKLALWDAETEA